MNARFLFLTLALGACGGAAFGQGVMSTFAGTEWIFPGDGKPAREAPLGSSYGIAADARGTTYFSDFLNHMVLRLRPDGIVEIVAGNGFAGFSGDDGNARNASLNGPEGIAIDAEGNLYIAEGRGHRVRRVSPSGVITTIAGSGTAGFSGDDGPATSARLNSPSGLAIDRSGTLYIADRGNFRLRAVSSDGTIRTIAGNGRAESNGDGGPASSAAVQPFYGVAAAADGTVYFSEFNGSRVRAIDRSGVIRTVAGNGERDFARNNTVATQSPLRSPAALALDSAGNLLIAESNGFRILRVDSSGTIRFVAGNGQLDGTVQEGPALASPIGFSFGLAADPAGNLYISDTLCLCLYRVDPAGNLRVAGGNGLYARVPDGSNAGRAFVFSPRGLLIDRGGNLVVATIQLSRLGSITPDGSYRHVAGTVNGCCRDGSQAARALLSTPMGLAQDVQGRLYIADADNHRIRRVAADGVIATFAGTGVAGFAGDGAQGSAAQFNQPWGIAFDPAGNLVVVDSGNRRIRRIGSDGVVRTLAGDGQTRFFGDGGPATAASFRRPIAVALRSNGEILIADLDDHRVRRIRPNGTIDTFAGTGTSGFQGDNGPATDARLSAPSGLAVDASDNVYILERDGHRVRRVDAAGVITTVAGNGRRGLTGDGGPSTEASLNGPILGIAVGPNGTLYISDSGNNRIRTVRLDRPTIAVEPAALSLTVRPGETTARVPVSVSTDVPGLQFGLSARTQDGSDWLRVSPRAGSAPGSLQIAADASGLGPGRYAGLVEVRSELATPRTVSIPVVLTVTAATPPQLSVQPRNITLAAQTGLTSAQKLTIANTGGGVLTFSASATTASGGNWLTVTPAQGSLSDGRPQEISLAVSAQNLRAGTYSGTVTFTANAGQPETVRVSLVVAERARPRILLSQTGLTFLAVAEGGLAAAQPIGILNQGAGDMTWGARTVTLAGGDWLKLNSNSGRVDRALLDVSFLEINADHRGLAPGDYYGRVEVTAESDNSPQVATVILKVLPAGSNPGPDVRPTGLVFTSIEGSKPGSQAVQVVNLRPNQTQYASSRLTFDGVTWLTHSPANGAVVPSDPGRVVVQPENESLSPGVRFGAITLQFEDRSIRTVSVLNVVAPAGLEATGKPGERLLAGCPSNNLRLEYTALADRFTAVVGEPTTIEVRIVDDCGTPLTPQTAPNAKVTAQFTNGDPQIDRMVHVGNGAWTGTWRPINAAGAVTVTVLALPGDTRSPVTGAQRLGTVQVGGRTPIVRQGSLRHSATLETEVPVAPGQLISVLGNNLADGERTVDGLPLPREVNQTEVLLAGRALPLLYTSDGQINAQVPYNLPANTEHQLYVRRGATLSVPQNFVVAEAQPGIFTENQQGTGQGFILRADGTTVARAATPANRGEEITILCTGLGEVTPAIEPGTPAPNPPPRTVVPVQVTIGGRSAEVRFSGLQAGVAGRYQVRAAVPADAPAGNDVPVVVTAAGRSSQAATIAIR